MKKKEITKKELKQEIENYLKILYRKTIEEADNQQIFQALSYALKDDIVDKWMATHKQYDKLDSKTVYYLSMEFLTGRALGNIIINLKADKVVRETLEEIGFNLDAIEDEEPDAALGNGGLGRLAACFLDSIASLGLPGDGIGLNYHFGLFKQVFKDRKQTAEPNDWIEDDSWLRDTDISFEVPFGDLKVKSKLYDIDVIGYNHGINKLHLFDIDRDRKSVV